MEIDIHIGHAVRLVHMLKAAEDLLRGLFLEAAGCQVVQNTLIGVGDPRKGLDEGA